MSEQKDKELQVDSIPRPMEFTDLIARILKDSILFVLIFSCVFSLMAMVGYNEKDPGWSHVGYQPLVSNWTGLVGALWADITLSFIGLLAWITPLMLLYPCIRLYFRKNVTLLDSLPFVMLRTVGAILFIFTTCALLSLHISNSYLNYPFTAGGIIGQAFAEWMVSWFSIQGGSVLLWFSAMIGLTCFMELSWRELIIKLGSALLSCFLYIKELLSSEKLADQDLETEEHPKELHSSSAEQPLFRSIATHVQKTTVDEARIGISAIDVAEDRVSNAGKVGIVSQVMSRFTNPTAERQITAKAGVSQRNQETAEKPSAESSPAAINASESSASNSQIKESSLPVITEPLTAKVETAVAAREPVKSAPSVAVAPSPQVVENTTASSSTVSEQISTVDEGRRSLKIVPLSEAHQSTLDQDSNFGQQQPQVAIIPKVKVPSVGLLDPAELQTEIGYTEEQLEDMSRLLEVKLKDFGVLVEVVEVNPGPVITRFEIQPAPGVKSSKIVNLAKDLARSLAVLSVRVVEVIPGKSVMGIEIPNINRKMVRLSEVLTHAIYQDAPSLLTLALGNDIAGNPVVANLAKMPHLLVAGTTGSGKSVGVNAMILSLLFKAGPEDVRLMLVDPKMLELSIYEGIPHLLTPVITDMKEAAGGLRWCVAEMERRYKLMSKMGVRNLDGFNDKVKKGFESGSPLLDPIWDPQEHGESLGTPAPQLETLPYIVVVIDEFADMMMIVGKKVEELIARIAQKARAAGIHLILATQRPSVDVITGLIKANVPTRIAFQVSSKIDSRTILDQGGAENLLGNGDMLYLPAGTSVPSRVHGAFVSDDEVHRTVEAWKRQGKPEFIDINTAEEGAAGASGSLFEDDEQDLLYDEAVAFITTTRKASISSVQRKFKIGYNRAARIVESMEAAGVITSAGTNGQREVIAPPPPPRDF
ncbi:MAG: cell division protein FtsK [Osedax symbiont Rs1]|nr:MAG: cell division protein FtsK [Osedax symbiont Rs1]